MGCGEGGRASGGIFLALWKKEMYLLPSLLLVGDFLPKSCLLIKYSPLCNLQTETLLQNPNVRFFLVYQSLCLTFCVGVACLGKLRAFSSLGGACYAHKTNGDFLG